jgi:hypothetical protein
MRDQRSRERRELPWELVEKPYIFEGEHGRQTLGDLFQGRSQLVIYHAMFNPDTAGPHTPWMADAPCYICSCWMDNFNGTAALMVAMVLLGMSSLWWAVILGAVVLIHKFAPPLRMRYELMLSAALVALGVAYLVMA